MLELIQRCPICLGHDIGFFLETKDFSVSQEVFTLSKCRSCNFVFTSPRPDENSIDKYYESSQYISHSNTKKGIINWIYQIVRSFSLKNKLRLISKYSGTDKTLLDIGCGTGAFLNHCKKHGWMAIGYEPNKNAREVALNEYGLMLRENMGSENFSPESFQIITLWHVLEHVHLLRKKIEDVSYLLKSKGKVLVALPNINSYDSLYYKKSWAAFDVPRHLYHFSAQNIKDLFKQYNFNLITSFPMKYDSYYVSILSEKYKQRSLPLIRGMYSGLKSNFLAANNPEKYSSVIYVFEKTILTSSIKI